MTSARADKRGNAACVTAMRGMSAEEDGECNVEGSVAAPSVAGRVVVGVNDVDSLDGLRGTLTLPELVFRTMRGGDNCPEACLEVCRDRPGELLVERCDVLESERGPDWKDAVRT